MFRQGAVALAQAVESRISIRVVLSSNLNMSWGFLNFFLSFVINLLLRYHASVPKLGTQGGASICDEKVETNL